MIRRPFAVALASAAALAACTSSSTSGSGAHSSAHGSSSGATQSGASTPTATDAAALAKLMQQGTAGIRSAHLNLSIEAAGQSITGSGDERLASGQLSALDVALTVPGSGAIRIIYTGGKTYAKLPASLNTSGKPYVLVSPTSSNAVVRSLAGSLQTSFSATSVDSYRAFVDAASSVTPRGQEQVGGVSTTHYSVVVDVNKLPTTTPAKQALIAGGVKTLPVELWVDAQGRPVRATQAMTVQGQKVSDTVTITNFNAPVSITAPPAGQVAN